MARPIASYSSFRRAGSTVYCSGQIPLNPETGELVAGSLAEQVDQALDNLAVVLAEAGSGMGQVVKTSVFLIDPQDYAEMDRAYSARFAAPFPAREAVFIAGLPRQARVEISAIAVDSQ